MDPGPYSEMLQLMRFLHEPRLPVEEMRRSIAEADQAVAAADADCYALALAQALNRAGQRRVEARDFAGSEPCFEGAMGTCEDAVGEDHILTLRIELNRSLVKLIRGHKAAAEAGFRRAKAIAAQLTPSSSDALPCGNVAQSLENLSAGRISTGSLAVAEMAATPPSLRKAYAVWLNDLAIFSANELEDSEAADALFTAAVGCDPTSPVHIANRAVILTSNLGRHDEAEHLYRRSLQIEPLSSTYACYGMLLAHLRNDCEEACRLLELALPLLRPDEEVWIPAEYASILILKGDHAGARRQIERAWISTRGIPSRFSLWAVFALAILLALEGRDPGSTLGIAKYLLETVGIPHKPWQVYGFRALLGARLPPVWTEALMSIHAAIGSRRAAAALQANDTWRTIQPRPLPPKLDLNGSQESADAA